MSDELSSVISKIEDATRELRQKITVEQDTEINKKLDNIIEDISTLKITINRIASTIATISTKNDQILSILSSKKIPVVEEKPSEPEMPEIHIEESSMAKNVEAATEEVSEVSEVSELSEKERTRLEQELRTLESNRDILQERLNELYELSLSDPTSESEYEAEIEEKESSLKETKKKIRSIKRKLGRS